MDAKQNLVGQWLHDHAETLEKEAKSAGLLDHGTMIGQVREFLVQSVLRRFLPPAVTIGSGRIFGAKGDPSKQIDIILADSRFPVFRYESGLGLYPVEAVIATIEVKSDLSSEDDVRTALSNCLSVLQCQAEWKSAHPIMKRISESGHAAAENRVDYRRFGYALVPATYVFSFRGTNNPSSLNRWVQTWFEQSGYPTTAPFHGVCDSLPRVIVCGGLVGLLNDETVCIHNSMHSETQRMLMVFGPFAHRFEALACHILSTVCRRMGTEHFDTQTRFEMQQHLPIADHLGQISEMARRDNWQYFDVNRT